MRQTPGKQKKKTFYKTQQRLYFSIWQWLYDNVLFLKLLPDNDIKLFFTKISRSFVSFLKNALKNG